MLDRCGVDCRRRDSTRSQILLAGGRIAGVVHAISQHRAEAIPAPHQALGLDEAEVVSNADPKPPRVGHATAERCGSVVTDRGDEHRTHECKLRKGHAPCAHTDLDGSEWTDAEHWGDVPIWEIDQAPPEPAEEVRRG